MPNVNGFHQATGYFYELMVKKTLKINNLSDFHPDACVYNDLEGSNPPGINLFEEYGRQRLLSLRRTRRAGEGRMFGPPAQAGQVGVPRHYFVSCDDCLEFNSYSDIENQSVNTIRMQSVFFNNINLRVCQIANIIILKN